MTHWMRSVLRRIKERPAQSAPATVRGGPSRKMSGVSTVEYALILVAVVSIVGATAVFLGSEFDVLMTNVAAEFESETIEAIGAGDDVDDSS